MAYSAPPNYCIPSLSPRGCTLQNCSLKHDIFRCSCGLILANIDGPPHLLGKRHLELFSARQNGRTTGQSPPAAQANAQSFRPTPNGRPGVNQTPRPAPQPRTFCTTCNKSVLSSNYEVHLTRNTHLRRVSDKQVEASARRTGAHNGDTRISSLAQSQQRSAVPAQGAKAPNTPCTSPQVPPQAVNQTGDNIQHCEVCDKTIPLHKWTEHLSKRMHLDAVHLLNMRKDLLWAESDKNGIVLSHRDQGIDFGVVEAAPDQPRTIANSRFANLRQTETEGVVLLVDIRMASASKDGQGTHFAAKLQGESQFMRNGRPRTVVVEFQPAHEGRYDDVMELLFKDTVRKERFVITRKLTASVGSKTDHEALKPKAPYVKKKWTPLQLDGPVVKVTRPPQWTETKWIVPLPHFDTPDDLIKVAFAPHVASGDIRARFMPLVFDENSYGRFFQVLLHINGEQMSRDLDNYSIPDATLKPAHPRYELEVAGLAEGRPSVLVGDFVLVKRPGMPNEPWYEGCVHHVYEKHISLRFDSNFSTYKGAKFQVRFKLNRLPLRRMHQAVTVRIRHPRILFPTQNHTMLAKPVLLDQLNCITPINRTIRDDMEQLEAVATIVHLPPGSIPFIVFGPPGTGKTVTIIEAIRQLLLADDDVRILACAPSNSAADLLANSLTVLGPSQLFRLNSLSRKYKDLPKGLQDFSLVNGNDVFAIPTKEKLEKYRVIVSTCISGGIPFGLGFKRGHFTHIFIDEAGQATEPEVMTPIKSMADDSTNIILAGDNKQLGPVVRSTLAAELGLKQSYLSRLMARPCYELSPDTKSTTIVKLVKNFRSHPAILQFSNQRFYNGELQACGDPIKTHILVDAEELVTKNFPLVFHGISGKDEQEESSPSFFNIDEATLVQKYCNSLVSNRKRGIRPEHIGVITPYHAQCHKILRLINRDDRLQGIKVGSVEEFQGQERRVIIISTVRSSADHVRTDIKRMLGFVANPARFNVAITRAQAMVILVGDPTILSLDPVWRSFLNYIDLRGGCRGKRIDWDPHELVRPNVRYDRELRQRAEGEMEDTITRLKALIIERSGEFDIDIDYSDSGSDDGGFMDRPALREED